MNIVCKLLTLGALALSAHAAFAQTDTVLTRHGNRFMNHSRLNGSRPQPGDFAFFHTYTFIGDTMLASTAESGGAREWQLPLQLPKRVPSLYDALLLMTKGDSATILQPVDSFLRRNLPPQWRRQPFVRYEIVLLDFYDQAEKTRRDSLRQVASQGHLTAVQTQTQALAQEFRAGKLKNKVQKTASGLQYIVHEPGPGAAVRKGEAIQVHYFGCLSDGKPFDESFGGGQPLAFPAGMGEMIAGFDEGVLLLRHGGKATLFIPHTLAWGDQELGGGLIPAKSDVVFYIEIQ